MKLLTQQFDRGLRTVYSMCQNPNASKWAQHVVKVRTHIAASSCLWRLGTQHSRCAIGEMALSTITLKE